ncbi:MAG TPA: DUF2752 domain-containing protein [Bacteroidota bacterium]|nr:DUF2752 domain-containing protein [Bacteroidota bacterium]
MPHKRFYTILTTLTGAGYFWIWRLSAAPDAGTAGTTLCLFHRLTGLPCPSCGVTRSIAMLMHGNLRGAVDCNPLGIVLLPVLLVLPWWLAADLSGSDASLFRFSEAVGCWFRRHRTAAAACIFLLLLNWGWNISKGL